MKKSLFNMHLEVAQESVEVWQPKATGLQKY